MKEILDRIYEHPTATIFILLALGTAAGKIAKALKN